MIDIIIEALHSFYTPSEIAAMYDLDISDVKEVARKELGHDFAEKFVPIVSNYC